MAHAQSQILVTLIAGENLGDHRIVTLDTANDEGTAVYVGTNGDAALGVCTQDASDGDPVSVQIAGIAKVRAGQNITAGQYVTARTTGSAQGADTVANNAQAIGKALETAVDGQIFEVLLLPQAAS